LGILVEEFHVGVCWCRVEIPVEFFDVLAMITLMTSDAKKALLEDVILAVPQRERQTHALAIIGDPGNTIFSPSISPRTCMLVGKVVPSVAVVRIVLSNGCLCTETYSRTSSLAAEVKETHPLPVRNIWAPSLPVDLPLAIGLETIPLGAMILVPDAPQ
jgi:hypothetical protein